VGYRSFKNQLQWQLHTAQHEVFYRGLFLVAILATSCYGGLSNCIQFQQLTIASFPSGLLHYSYRLVQGRYAYSLYSDILPTPTNSHAANWELHSSYRTCLECGQPTTQLRRQRANTNERSVLFNGTVSCKDYIASIGAERYGALVEWYWQGKAEVLGEQPAAVPICRPQTPHGLAWNHARALRWSTNNKNVVL
jgi:hypothetical protein